jgi:hypothetical protein
MQAYGRFLLGGTKQREIRMKGAHARRTEPADTKAASADRRAPTSP